MKKDVIQTWEIEGFSFTDENQAKTAQKELEGVKYIKNNIDLDNPDMVLEMYNRVIEQKLFATPVGYSYLKEMQEYLITIPYIMNQDIQAIKVEDIPATSAASDAVRKKELRHKRRDKDKNIDKKQRDEQKPAEETSDKKKQQMRNLDFRKRYKASFGMNVVLIIIVIAMFAISLTSGSTTIVNYENKIIDKYEHWEQELSERETAVSEREAALLLDTEQ